jgi:glycosyltransferase involved in cell wall biosynthesis
LITSRVMTNCPPEHFQGRNRRATSSWQERRMRVLIVTAMYPTPDNPAFGSFVRTQVQSLERAGVAVEVLVLAGRFRKLIYPKGMVQLRQRLARNSIDLVHAHYGYVGIVARTQRKVPVVVTFHGDDLLGTIDERGRQTHRSKVVAASSRALSRYVDGVIVQSKEMSYKIAGTNVHVVPHEIDFDIFRPIPCAEARAALGLDPAKKFLLFASPPHIPVKRFPLAEAVANELARRDRSIELLVVYRETQDRLSLYMNACDALVFSSFQEGSPNAVKQAMACNLPIVSTDVGDVRDVIEATPGCYVCDADVQAFAERLESVLRAGSRTDGRRAVRHLSCSAVAQRVIAVYESALAHATSRRRPTAGAAALP